LADDNLYVAKGRGGDQVVPDKHDLIANAKNKPS
jgi:c-di-AMP phosphodiesterase-like protein